MKKSKLFVIAGLITFGLLAAGCGEKEEASIEDKDVFEEELTPLTDDEIEQIEGGGMEQDDEMRVVSESELDALGDMEEETDSNQGVTVKEDQTYTSMEEVAVYIHTYDHLPSNYITLKEAEALGYSESQANLASVAPGKSIGGDIYENEEKMLPVKDGLTYQQCDINSEDGVRTDERLIYGSDGSIYYTPDLFATFQQIY